MTFKVDGWDWQIRRDGHWLMLKVDNATQIIDQLMVGKRYDCEIKRHREKRSLDANAYMWVLLGKLSAVINVPPEDIYRNIIRDVGDNYDIVPIREEAVDRWIKVWESNGIGNVADDLGECRNTKGYHNIRCYYGSSCYDKRQFSRLLDLVCDECKLQGVETMPPEELEALVGRW